jgi:hypothetical protein
MKWILTVMSFIFISGARADVDQKRVEQMLEQMVRENVISQTEAEKVKIRMKGMTTSQWSDINSKAKAIAARSPASVSPSENKIEEVHSIDLDGAQFKEIESEMKKILPRYQD